VLTRLDLQQFKCFESLRLPLGQLTLLSGSNASGKSSALQALVLLHQTMREHEWSTRLILNGQAIRLGTVADVVDKLHGRRSFEIGVLDDQACVHWVFTGDRGEMSMEVERVILAGSSHEAPKALQHLLPPDQSPSTTSLAHRLRDLTYITAERVGPREVYPLEDRQTARVVGPQGEQAVSVLYWGRDEHVIEGLVLHGAAPTRLHQVQARMRTLFPGCGIIVQQVAQANVVTLGLRTAEDTDFHRPIHVGFGITQILPIVVAALSASQNDILLIENPEVHLHPAGQAQMGQFLAEVASAGVQIIVETHSDHVLNGIRRSVKSGKLTPEQVVIHFFVPRGGNSAQIVSPTMARNGNLDAWPEGFFDQFDKDMNYFAGWAD
jgi:predicted ATPase